MKLISILLLGTAAVFAAKSIAKKRAAAPADGTASKASTPEPDFPKERSEHIPFALKRDMPLARPQ